MSTKQTRVNWTSAITDLAPTLCEAVNSRPNHVPCTVHGGIDGLRCFDDFDDTGGMVCNTCGYFPSGIDVLVWINNWTRPEAREAVKRITPKTSASPLSRFRREKTTKPPYNGRAANQIHAITRDCVSINDGSAEVGRLYLKGRGLDFDYYDEALLFHPALPYYEDGTYIADFPALVAQVWRIDELVTLHRTYLEVGGQKADVASPRKLCSPVYKGASKGAAVQLDIPTDGVLCVTEGIETGIAVQSKTGIPVWAAISAGGMKNIIIPSTIKNVRIYSDNDANRVGQRAASALAERLTSEGKSVKIYTPPNTGADWLDEYVKVNQ